MCSCLNAVTCSCASAPTRAAGTPSAFEANAESLAARHECGLFAAVSISGRHDVVAMVVEGLRGLQHRGQQSAGIVIRHRDGLLDRVVDLGLVSVLAETLASAPAPASTPRPLEPESAVMGAIGHVRYATFGSPGHPGAQPVVRGSLGFAFAGHIAGLSARAGQVEDVADDDRGQSDAAMLAGRVHRSLEQGRTLARTIADLLDDVDGAVNVLALTSDGQFVAARDRNGFRPLHWAVSGDLLLVSSEDHLLETTGRSIHELGAGEVLSLRNGEVAVHRVGTRRLAACSFEYVYFSHPAASFEGRSIRAVRERFGTSLAAEESTGFDQRDTVVVPIPQTGTVAALAYARELALPLAAGIVVGDRSTRTFISSDPGESSAGKFHIVPDSAVGRHAILVDDSLVRGTTLQRLVPMFRKIARPLSIHVRLAAPPVLHPCYYGIDIPDRTDLLAVGLQIDRAGEQEAGSSALARRVGADSVRFLSQDGFREAFEPRGDDVCRACLTGDYPTPAGRRRAGLAGAAV